MSAHGEIKPGAQKREQVFGRPFAWCGAALAAALLIGACATDMPQNVALPDRVTYRCEGGQTFEVHFGPSREVATVYVSGKSYRLPRVPGPTQAKFSDNATTLWLDGQNALVESRVAVVGQNCASERPLAEGARPQRPLFGSDPWWR